MTDHPALGDDASMRTFGDQRGFERADASSWPAATLLNDMIDRYVDWRESATAVAAAYSQWSFTPGTERPLRFAAYAATLDQEQKAAAVYAAAVTEVERWLQRSRSRRRF